MAIMVRQQTEQISENRWEWTVWLEATEAEIAAIDAVSYQLHSSFKNPIRVKTDPADGFRLSSSGWGEFMIYLSIQRPNQAPENLQHWLSLGDSAPNKEFEELLGKPLTTDKPTAFLSYSIVDASVANVIRNNLQEKGVAVLDMSSIDPGLANATINATVENMIDRADFGVSIVSDVNSPWVTQETNIMQQHELPILEVYTDSDFGQGSLDLIIQPMVDTSAEQLVNLIDESISLTEFKK